MHNETKQAPAWGEAKEVISTVSAAVPIDSLSAGLGSRLMASCLCAYAGHSAAGRVEADKCGGPLGLVMGGSCAVAVLASGAPIGFTGIPLAGKLLFPLAFVTATSVGANLGRNCCVGAHDLVVKAVPVAQSTVACFYDTVCCKTPQQQTMSPSSNA